LAQESPPLPYLAPYLGLKKKFGAVFSFLAGIRCAFPARQGEASATVGFLQVRASGVGDLLARNMLAGLHSFSPCVLIASIFF
jgi:hypothetical protein